MTDKMSQIFIVKAITLLYNIEFDMCIRSFASLRMTDVQVGRCSGYQERNENSDYYDKEKRIK